MIRLPFAIPSPSDWKIDWAGICDSGLGELLEEMRGVCQNPIWHGEGDVLTHTRLVCEALAGDGGFRESDGESRAIVFIAALLHDVGKVGSTRLEDGVWTSRGHSASGARIARKFLWQSLGMAGTDEARRFRESVCSLIRFHSMPIHFLSKDDPERQVRSIAAEGCIMDGFTLERLAMLVKADILGRKADDLPRLLDELSLFASTAKELGCFSSPPQFADEYSRFAWLQSKTQMPDHRLYDDTWGTVYMMCALPGTGKDTWIRENLPELPVVSLDAIRNELGISWEGNQAAVATVALERARVLLRERRPFVWNATCLLPDFRRRALQLFQNYGAFTRIVVLETSWDENLKRNKERSAVVSESAIDEMLGRFTPPSVREAHALSWHVV